MKKIIALLILCVPLLFTAPGLCDGPARRGLYVSMIQDPPVLAKRDDIIKLIKFSKEARIDEIFVQVYRANRSWFLSRAADSSLYETCVADGGQDPLELLIKEAHASGIRVHAWLNILSLSANTDAPILKKYGSSILTRNLKSKRVIEDYKIDDQYFLEPGDLNVRAELANMVEDLLRAYPGLDGIQFDYIRYPDRNPAYGYTAANAERFKQSTGLGRIDEDSGIWKEWKRKQVTELLNVLVRTAKAARPDITISATACAPYIRAYHEAYQDWPYWLNSGLVDGVTFMSYTTDADRFESYIAGAKKMTNDFSKVSVAIGAYEMAGSAATLRQQMEMGKALGANGCVILHYGSLLEDPALGDILKNN